MNLIAFYKSRMTRPQWTNLTNPTSSEEGKALNSSKLHICASSLVRLSAVQTLGAVPLKIQSFRCFQMLQAPRIVREFRPFRASPLTEGSTFAHQSSKDDSAGCGASEERPTCCRREYQNCLANTHRMRRCWMFSSLSHSRHRSGWGRPHRASLSAVQLRLWATNHMMKRHLGGAHNFRILS
jgi:hypothetical protein